MSKTVEDIMDSIPTAAFRDEGKFVPKLNFAERCEILAFYRKGISRVTLAAAFGVDRRTITHIYTSKSPHYKSVRREEEILGRVEFIKKFITEAGAMRIAAVQEQTKETAEPNKAVKAANKFRGVNLVANDYTKFEHRIMIEWHDGVLGEGWYYKDIDGANPEEYVHNGPETIRTSQECLKGAKEYLFDL